MSAKLFFAVLVAFCAFQGLTTETPGQEIKKAGSTITRLKELEQNYTKSNSSFDRFLHDLTTKLEETLKEYEEKAKESGEYAETKRKEAEFQEKLKQCDEEANKEDSSSLGQSGKINIKRSSSNFDSFLHNLTAQLQEKLKELKEEAKARGEDVEAEEREAEIKEKVKKCKDAVKKEFSTQLGQSVLQDIKRSLSDSANGFQNTSAQIKEKLKAIINKVKTQIGEINEKYKGKTAEIQEKVKQLEEAAKKKLLEIISQISQNDTKTSKRDLLPMIERFKNRLIKQFNLTAERFRVNAAAVQEAIRNATLGFTEKMNVITNGLEGELKKIAEATIQQFKNSTSDVSECYNAQKENASRIVGQVKTQIKDLIAYEKQTYIQPLLDQANATSQKVDSLATEGENCDTLTCITDVLHKGMDQGLYLEIRNELVQVKNNEVKATRDAYSKLPGIIQPAIAESKENAEATAQCIRSKSSS